MIDQEAATLGIGTIWTIAIVASLLVGILILGIFVVVTHGKSQPIQKAFDSMTGWLASQLEDSNDKRDNKFREHQNHIR